MIIYNSQSSHLPLYLNFLNPPVGRWLPYGESEQITIDDSYASDSTFKALKTAGKITVVSWGSDSMDYVVQDELALNDKKIIQYSFAYRGTSAGLAGVSVYDESGITPAMSIPVSYYYYAYSVDAAADITAGSMTIQPRKTHSGVGADLGATIVLDDTHQHRAAVLGTPILVAAEDLIGCNLTTSGDLAPANDLKVTLYFRGV